MARKSPRNEQDEKCEPKLYKSYSESSHDVVLRSLSVIYFDGLKESFNPTVLLKTRWPGLESSLSRQK